MHRQESGSVPQDEKGGGGGGGCCRDAQRTASLFCLFSARLEMILAVCRVVLGAARQFHIIVWHQKG